MVVVSWGLGDIVYCPSQLRLCPFLDLISFDKGEEHQDLGKQVNHLGGVSVDPVVNVPFLHEGLRLSSVPFENVRLLSGDVTVRVPRLYIRTYVMIARTS